MSMKLWISCVALVSAFGAEACIDPLALPEYPRLARMAGFQGSVEVSFRVDANGYLFDVATAGNPLLAPAAAKVTEGVRLDPAVCGLQNFTVKYRYVFEPMDSPRETTVVTYVAPNEFRVVANRPLGMECLIEDLVIRQSRRKRLVRMVFRHGQ